MSGESMNFADKKVNKSNFYKNKRSLKIDDKDVNKTLVSEKEPYGKKAHLNTLLDTMIMMK